MLDRELMQAIQFDITVLMCRYTIHILEDEQNCASLFVSQLMTPPVFQSLFHICGWDGPIGRGFIVILCAAPGLMELSSLPAA